MKNITLRILIILSMICLITLSTSRYIADIHYNHAQQSRHLIHKWVNSAELSVKYSPYQREYNNSLAFAYLNMAIKLGVDNEWESAWEWLLKSVYIGRRVQRYYPGDYHSAYTLKKAYTALNMLSQEDMSRHIDKYDRIMKYTRPLSSL